MAEETGLMVVSGYTAVQIFAPGVPDKLIDEIEKAARAEAAHSDISTEAGRKAVASLAYKVARTKTAIDNEGKSLVEGEKKRLALIDAERKKVRDRLDALKEEVRKPLDEYEEVEKARVAAHEATVSHLSGLIVFDFEPGISTLESRLASARAATPDNHEEFKQRVAAAQNAAVMVLEAMIEKAQRAEAERSAEAERLRLEQEEAQRKREEAIAEAARQAEQRRAEEAAREAAEAAERERQRIIREAAEREAREKAEKEAAEQRARQAEADRVAAEERAKREAAETAARVERERIEAERRAEEAKAAAVRAERERIEAAQRAEEEAEQLRQQNRAHRTKLNAEAASAFRAAGFSEEQSKTIVKLIAQGVVPNVRIAY